MLLGASARRSGAAISLARVAHRGQSVRGSRGRAGLAVAESSEQSRELMRRITTGIWDEGHLDLIDELIAADLIDHIEDPTLEGVGR
jgi:hypothetical protein